jgi:hypothetical protein
VEVAQPVILIQNEQESSDRLRNMQLPNFVAPKIGGCF